MVDRPSTASKIFPIAGQCIGHPDLHCTFTTYSPDIQCGDATQVKAEALDSAGRLRHDFGSLPESHEVWGSSPRKVQVSFGLAVRLERQNAGEPESESVMMNPRADCG